MADGVAERVEGISPYQGVADRFYKGLEAKGIAFAPEKYEGQGVLAIGGTNESGNPHLFEKLKSQPEAPDGYLIGIGAANVFSMLEAFPEGSEPKSILLFDIDPQVVAIGQSLIDHFKGSDTYPQAILGDPQLDGYYKNTVFPEGMGAQFKNALRKHGSLLHKLAKEGRFGIARVNFTDPKLMEELSDLPDLKNSNNLVYLSNISDHIWRANQANVPDFSFLDTLSPNPPHKNYHIDTLTKSLGYRLRISSHRPQFIMDDFDYRVGSDRFQTRPTDGIEGEPQNLLWEDMSSWDLQKLFDEYNRIEEVPSFKSRKEFIQGRIRETRQDLLGSYADWKSKSGQPELVAGDIFRIRSVPASKEEETALLADLALPYDYEADFIPFIARHYWSDAKTIQEVDPTKFPTRPQNYRIDQETGKRLMVSDARELQKGRIETWYLDKVPYEELVAAKIYAEVENRLLARNPGANTGGKNINRLSQELQFGRRAA